MIEQKEQEELLILLGKLRMLRSLSEFGKECAGKNIDLSHTVLIDWVDKQREQIGKEQKKINGWFE